MTYTPKGKILGSDISVAQLSDIANNLGTINQGDFGGALVSATGSVSSVGGSVTSLGGTFAGSMKMGSPAASQVIDNDGSYMGVVEIDLRTVSIGPNNSAGTSYRALRVPNG